MADRARITTFTLAFFEVATKVTINYQIQKYSNPKDLKQKMEDNGTK
jgi:hypothetical protein